MCKILAQKNELCLHNLLIWDERLLFAKFSERTFGGNPLAGRAEITTYKIVPKITCNNRSSKAR